MSYITAITGTMPSRTDNQEDFSDNADALVAALPTLQSQINTVVDEINDSVDAVEADRVAVVALKGDVTTLKADCETIKGLCEDAQDLAEDARDASEGFRDSALAIAAAAQSAAGIPGFAAHPALSTLRINAEKTGVEWGVSATPSWRGIYYTSSSTTWTVPDGVSCIRIYAGGKGGNSGPTVTVSETTSVTNRYAKAQVGSGGGGGLAWGTLDVVPGDIVTINVNSGTSTVIAKGETLMSATPGGNGTSASGINTGSDPTLSVSNGTPGTAQILSSLVYDSGNCSGSSYGGAGNPTGVPISAGSGLSTSVRSILNRFSDPLLADANGPSGTCTSDGSGGYIITSPLSGGAGHGITKNSTGSATSEAGNGADFGGGGNALAQSSPPLPDSPASATSVGGHGGILAPGGSASSTAYSSNNATAISTPGNGGLCGGGGTATSSATIGSSGQVVTVMAATAIGGSALVIIMY